MGKSLDVFYRGSERRKRISVDLDQEALHTDKLALLKVFFELKNGFPKGTVNVDKTGHGYHVKAIDEKISKIPMAKRLEIREGLGDDPMRVEWDRQKLEWGEEKLCETLFSMKKGFDGVTRIVYPFNPLMMPYASQIPARKP